MQAEREGSMTDLARLARIRDRIQHGIPPEDVIEDTRFLLGHIENLLAREAAFDWAEAARLPPRRKRCGTCNGEGTTSREQIDGWDTYRCSDCRGTGYVEASDATDDETTGGYVGWTIVAEGADGSLLLQAKSGARRRIWQGEQAK